MISEDKITPDHRGLFINHCCHIFFMLHVPTIASILHFPLSMSEEQLHAPLMLVEQLDDPFVPEEQQHVPLSMPEHSQVPDFIISMQALT